MRMIAGKTPGWKDTLVYLDGTKIDRCIEADDAEGWARVSLTWEERMLSNDPMIEDRIVRGVVEFRPVVR